MSRVRSAPSRVGAAARMPVVALVMLVVAVVAGCSGEDEPTVPTAGGTPTAAVGPDALAQELAFVACMREQGIADMPDPVPGDTSGRSAVKYAIDVMGKGSDSIFQAALDECMALLPPPAPEPRPTEDIEEALRRFSQCMRENGLPDFPDLDPEQLFTILDPGAATGPPATVEGGAPGQTEVGALVDLTDPVVAAAWEACHPLFPSQ